MNPVAVLLYSVEEYTLDEYEKAFPKHWNRGRLFKSMRRNGFKCMACGDPAVQVRKYKSPPDDKIYTGVITASYEQMTLDHILPKSKGGSNGQENLQPLCRPCNAAKGDSYESFT